MTGMSGVQNTQGINLPGFGQEKEKHHKGEFAALLGEESAYHTSIPQQVRDTSREIIAAHNKALLQGNEVPDPKREFLDFVNQSSAEMMREQILLSLGLTEEDLEAMPPEERMAVEKKIAEIIQEKVRQEVEEQMASVQTRGMATGAESGGDSENELA